MGGAGSQVSQSIHVGSQSIHVGSLSLLGAGRMSPAQEPGPPSRQPLCALAVPLPSSGLWVGDNFMPLTPHPGDGCV